MLIVPFLVICMLIASFGDIRDTNAAANEANKRRYSLREVVELMELMDLMKYDAYLSQRHQLRGHHRKDRSHHRDHIPAWREWGQWSAWHECSVTCGTGQQTRWRQCLGQGCEPGEQEGQVQTCQESNCTEMEPFLENIAP